MCTLKASHTGYLTIVLLLQALSLIILMEEQKVKTDRTTSLGAVLSGSALCAFACLSELVCL